MTGKHRMQPLAGFPWEDTGSRAHSLGLAGLRNSSGLWDTGVGSSYLVPGPGLSRRNPEVVCEN